MKLFDKYFAPYAQYCVRTAFSEEELKKVFEKEFPFREHIIASFKLMFDSKKISFVRGRNALVLHPYLYGNNPLRGEIHIRCEQTANSSETILHIDIVPPNCKLLLYCFNGFSVIWGIAATCAGWWWAFAIPLVFFIFNFIVFEFCRETAANEISRITKSFEITLRELENKYRRVNND